MNLDRMETETALKIFEVVVDDGYFTRSNPLRQHVTDGGFSEEEHQSVLYMIKRFKAYLPNANELRSE